MTQATMNRVHNSSNPYQRDFKKVLCLCSAGLLRSPTVAWVLGQEPYLYNTRAAGIEETYALIPVDEVLIRWADEVVCVHPSIHDYLKEGYKELFERLGDTAPKLVTLNLPDIYAYRDPKLVEIIKQQYAAATTHNAACLVAVSGGLEGPCDCELVGALPP